MPAPVRLITLNIGSQTIGLAEFRLVHGHLALVNYRFRETPLDPETGQRRDTQAALHETAVALREMMHEMLHREIASVSAAARVQLLPFASKMPAPVAQARKFARERVAGKLARLDELTRKLLLSQTERRGRTRRPVYRNNYCKSATCPILAQRKRLIYCAPGL